MRFFYFEKVLSPIGQAYDGESLVEGGFSMKRLFGLIIFILILYVIYFDLSNGTLPIALESTSSANIVDITNGETTTQDYFEKKVQSGDTVLSIIESHLNSSVPIPIEQIIDDFKRLNDGVDTEKIQIGKTYKFPNYRGQTDDSSN